jgi:hypothetical protein
MPAGAEVTVPEPVTSTVTGRRIGVKAAVTV